MLLFILLTVLEVPPLPSTDTVRAVWLADLDPARVAGLAVPGPLPAAGRLQSFSLPVPPQAATLWRAGAEV
jgi:hypothetical protein